MTKQNCRIAALQMVSGPRVGDNLALAGRLVAEAVDRIGQRDVLTQPLTIKDSGRPVADHTEGADPSHRVPV